LKLIDFDKRFSDFTSKWMSDHGKEYKNFEAMEADMPNVYLRFLNTPAPWLEGVTPGSYFTQFEDPKELVDWMRAYCEKRVPVPDLLLDQIQAVGLPCEKRLVALLKDKEAPQEARMTAVGLLREMESDAPRAMYIAWQVERKEKDELADNALESLHNMGVKVVKPMLDALNRATPAGQEALLDVLCDYPGEEKVFQLALKLFEENPKRRALFASYLGKLGDDRALPALMKAAEDPKLSYLDFIEVRSAIEELGGDCPEREFDDDAAYEALQRLQ